MVHCSVFGCIYNCNSARFEKDSWLSFHRFPTDGMRKSKWILACGRPDWVPTHTARICSRHFEPHFLCHLRETNYLSRNAIPTKFIHAPEVTICSKVTKRTGKKEIPEKPTKRNFTLDDPLRKKELNRKPINRHLLAEHRKPKIKAGQQRKRYVQKQNAQLTNLITDLKLKYLISSREAQFLKTLLE